MPRYPFAHVSWPEENLLLFQVEKSYNDRDCISISLLFTIYHNNDLQFVDQHTFKTFSLREKKKENTHVYILEGSSDMRIR